MKKRDLVLGFLIGVFVCTVIFGAILYNQVNKNNNISKTEDINKFCTFDVYKSIDNLLNEKEFLNGCNVNFVQYKYLIDQFLKENNFVLAGDLSAMKYFQNYKQINWKSGLPGWIAKMKRFDLFVSNNDVVAGTKPHTVLINSNDHFANPNWPDWNDHLKKMIPNIFDLEEGYHLIIREDQLIFYINSKNNVNTLIDNLFGSNSDELNLEVSTTYINKADKIHPPYDRFVDIPGDKPHPDDIMSSSIGSSTGENDEYFETLVIGSRAEPVESFTNRFLLNRVGRMSSNYVTDESIKEAKLVISLFTKLDEIVPKLVDMFPEIKDLEYNEYFSKEINGIHYVFIYSKDYIDLEKMALAISEDVITEESEGLVDISNVKTKNQVTIESIKNNSKVFSTEDNDIIIYIEPNPDKGFNYPYMIQLPSVVNKEKNKDKTTHLIFEINNPRMTNNFDQTIISAIEFIQDEWRVMKRVSEELYLPRVMPITPRPEANNITSKHGETIKPQDLDSTTIYLEKEINNMRVSDPSQFSKNDLSMLFNFEEQMYNILQDAKRRLKEAGYEIDEKAFIGGFSTGGVFANRFSSIYPEEFQAVYVGGAFHPIMPSSSYNGEYLIYPIGVYNHLDLFGEPFDKEAYDSIAKLYHMGLKDTNDPLWGHDTYRESERQLIIKLFGKDNPQKWFNIMDVYYELGGTGQFITSENEKHSYNNYDIKYIIEFFEKNRGTKNSNYNIEYNHPSLQIRNK